MYIYICIYVYVRMCVYVNIYIYVCMYIYIYVHVTYYIYQRLRCKYEETYVKRVCHIVESGCATHSYVNNVRHTHAFVILRSHLVWPSHYAEISCVLLAAPT